MVFGFGFGFGFATLDHFPVPTHTDDGNLLRKISLVLGKELITSAIEGWMYRSDAGWPLANCDAVSSHMSHIVWKLVDNVTN